MQEGFDRDGTLVDKTAAYAPLPERNSRERWKLGNRSLRRPSVRASHEQKKKLMNWLIRSIKREAPWPGNMAIHLCSMSLDVN